MHDRGYLPRTLESALAAADREFPVVMVVGPRQSGKTTLLRHLFEDSRAVVSVEPPDVRASARADPRAFLAAYPPPVVIDEIQWVPDLLPYIKERVDRNRTEPGQYIVTGSGRDAVAQ